jgi:hypothetical protein
VFTVIGTLPGVAYCKFLLIRRSIMRKIQALVITLAMGATLAVSAAALTFNSAQNSNAEACCDMKDCCKDGAMSCCKKKKKGKNAHSCCAGKDGAAGCCCKGDSCPMPNKKPTGNSNGN